MSLESRPWTILPTLPERAFHSDETAELRTELSAEIGSMTGERKALDRTVEEARDTTVEELSYDSLKNVEAYRELRFNLLRDEIGLRERISEFFRRENVDIRAALDATVARLGKLPGEIAERLEGIGYLPFDRSGNQRVGVWTLEMVNRHPSMLAARDSQTSLRSILGSRDRDPMNKECLQSVRAELEAYRSVAVAV